MPRPPTNLSPKPPMLAIILPRLIESHFERSASPERCRRPVLSAVEGKEIGEGKIIHRFGESDIEDKFFWAPRPIGSTSLFKFFTDRWFHTYTYLNDEVKFLLQIYIFWSDWISAPSDFPGEAACQQ